jgi:hypothetical protein
MKDWVDGRWGAALAALGWAFMIGCGSGSPASTDGSHLGDARAEASSGEAGVDAPFEGPGAGAKDAGTDAPVDARVAVDTGVDASASDAIDAPEVGPTGPRWVALPASLGTPISAVAVSSDGTVYAGTNGGGISTPTTGPGIFRSTDNGGSWQPVNVGLDDFQVATLFATGGAVYAGTINLVRSTDHGASWQQSTPVGALDPFTSIDGQGALLVAAPGFNGGGIYVSSDGGGSFTQRSRGATGVAVAGGAIVLADSNGLARSTDLGVTFSPVQGFTNSIQSSARVACDHVSTCYASAFDTTQSNMLVLLKSTDAGATWTHLARTGSYLVALADSGALYVTSGTLLARSDDGGATFTNIFPPTTTDAFQPNCSGPYALRGDQIYAACPNGVYRSSDKGAHWQAASGSPTAGAIMGGVYRLFVDRTSTSLGPSGDLYVSAAGASGSGSRFARSSDGGWTWQPLPLKSIPGTCVFTASGAIECNAADATTGAGAVVRSDDHGATWSTVTLPAGAPTTISLVAGGGSTVYVGGNGVARSDDGGVTFHPLAGAPTVTVMQVLKSGHVLAAGPNSSMPYRSVDGGLTWQTLSMFLTLPVLEDASGRLIATELDDILITSTDEGSTWTSFAADGLFGPYLPFGIDGAGRLYATGKVPISDVHSGFPRALYASVDGGSTWAPFPVPIPNPNVRTFATDKQGRLLAATAGGLFRLELPDDPGPAPPAAGADAGAPPPPRPITVLAGGVPWHNANGLLTLAADGAQNVYGADINNVYLLANGATTTYLTSGEAATALGFPSGGSEIVDLDVGPDGLLYALITAVNSLANTSANFVVRVPAAHQATLMAGPATLALDQRMEVVTASQFALGGRDGLVLATSTALQTIYPAATLQASSGCPIADLGVTTSGTVAVIVGCMPRPVLRGTLAGAAPIVLHQPDPDPTSGERFACMAADPAGGFFFVVTSPQGNSPRLYHLPENAVADTPMTLVPTEPSLGELFEAGGPTSSAYTMTVAPNGVIYIQTAGQVYQIGL